MLRPFYLEPEPEPRNVIREMFLKHRPGCTLLCVEFSKPPACAHRLLLCNAETVSRPLSAGQHPSFHGTVKLPGVGSHLLEHRVLLTLRGRSLNLEPASPFLPGCFPQKVSVGMPLSPGSCPSSEGMDSLSHQ